MKIDSKFVFKTALTLTIIASTGALLISSVNLLTAPIIAQNASAKEQRGLAEVFGDSMQYDPEEKVELENEHYLLSYYPITNIGGEGRVYKTKGTNAYGEISLLVGLTATYSLYNIYVLSNEQSFGTMLEENYISPLEEAGDKDDALDKVSCGATYGAKLIRDMVNEAKAHYEKEDLHD